MNPQQEHLWVLESIYRTRKCNECKLVDLSSAFIHIVILIAGWVFVVQLCTFNQTEYPVLLRNIFVVFDLPAGWASLPGHSEQLGGVTYSVLEYCYILIMLHLSSEESLNHLPWVSHCILKCSCSSWFSKHSPAQSWAYIYIYDSIGVHSTHYRGQDQYS